MRSLLCFRRRGPSQRPRKNRGVGPAKNRRWQCLLAVVAVLLPAQVAAAGTLISMNTTYGTIQVDLFDSLTPVTVQNFVTYINLGAFNNTIFHRSVTNFVIQGGGFNTDRDPIAGYDQSGNPNDPGPLIPLEYARNNTRGTIAMARRSEPNSASSQFFFNTVNNSTSLGPRGPSGTPGQPNYDPGSDGYAVFGWVVSGMNVVDTIAALPKFNINNLDPGDAPFTYSEIPLRNYTQQNLQNGVPVTADHEVIVSSVSVVKTHPHFQNPILAVDVDNDGSLFNNDAKSIIDDLLLNGAHDAPAVFGGIKYLDVDGNGKMNAKDALKVINALIAASAGQPASPLGAVDNLPIQAVPEPTSWAMACSGAIGLAGLALRRWQRRRRMTR